MVVYMIKISLNFFDKHRILLIFLLIFIFFGMFLGIKSLLFINHNFKALECKQELNAEKCYYENTLIFVNPAESKKKFFEEYYLEITNLKKNYELPEFNMHTAYFYEVASLLDYNMAEGKEEVYNFFKTFSDTYNLKDFYQKNIVFYDLFYPDRISINLG